MTQEDIIANWEAKDFFFEKLPLKEYIDRMEEPAVAAFSSYLWNHKYQLGLAKAIKDKWPSCVIVFGGPEIPEVAHRLDDFYAEHPFVDYTVHAEGEYAFANLLRQLDGKVTDLMNPDQLPQGVTTKGRYQMIKPDRIMDLDDTPSPYQNGLAQSLIDRYPGRGWSAVIETSRGCPFKCTFCDWGSLTYAKTKKFEQEYVYGDLDFLGKNKIPYVYFADANFGIFKNRDDEIIDYLIDVKEKTGFPEAVNFNWQKNSTIKTISTVKKLADVGFDRGFTLSVQSMSMEVLEIIERSNMDVNNFNAILDECNRLGVPTYSEMIVGLPGETLDSWKEGHFKLLSAGQHNFIDVYPGLTLVNAELATDESREKYGIKTMRVKNPFRPDFNDVFDGIYEEGEYIVETNTLPHEDFLSCFLFSWMITNFHGYGWTEIISRWLFAKGEATYDRFYSDLYEFIQKDDFFSEFHSDYLSKLREKYSEDGFGGITYLTYAYSALIFDNFETTNKKIREFLDEYGYDVPLDVIEYNEEYVMNYNDQTDKMITFTLPVWHVINNEEFEEQDFYSYYFKNREPEEEEQELFNKRLYYMRRQGFGRFKVQPNND